MKVVLGLGLGLGLDLGTNSIEWALVNEGNDKKYQHGTCGKLKKSHGVRGIKKFFGL